MFRVLGFALLAGCVALGWGVFVGAFEVAKTHDIRFIADHCPKAVGAAEGHIFYDGGAFTTYIYEQTPGVSSDGDFVVAYSDMTRDFFCAPYLGCAIPLHLREECFP